jgi:beta-N-acetylhexosaminidase
MQIGAFISGCGGYYLSQDERRFFETTKPWGLIVFRRNCESPEQIKALATDFRAIVERRNAPVFVDQEGGRVQRLGPPANHWRKYPPAGQYGALYRDDPLVALRAARNVGRLMAEDLIQAGINADCLPVLDVPQPDGHNIIGDRAYARDVAQIIALARAHMAGMMEGGVLPVIKHIPGHGRAKADSHLELPVVSAKRAELEAVDFPPFAALADAPMAMTAHVVYTAFDKDAPATLSKKVIRSVIRKTIGFRGLLMSDDLSMNALKGTLGERAAGALQAGCDILLHCNGQLGEMEQVAQAAGPLKGRALSRARLALKAVGRPQRYDKPMALKDLDRLATA